MRSLDNSSKRRTAEVQFYFNIDQFATLLREIDNWLRSIAIQYGYFGMFLVSLVGASSIIIPLPYTILIFFMGKILNPFFLAISAGIGSGIGEFFGYALGYFGRTVINEERKRKMNYILKVFNRCGAVTIFLFALLPLPDDLLFVPLGIMRYSFIRAFVPCILGKFLMSLILAYAGYFSIGFIESIFGAGGGLLTTLATTALLIIVVILMFKIDWEKIFPLDEKENHKRK